MGLGQNSGNWYGSPYGVQDQLMSTGWATNPYDPYGTNIMPTFSYEPIGAHQAPAPTVHASPFPTYTATTPTVNTTPTTTPSYDNNPIRRTDPIIESSPTQPVVASTPTQTIASTINSITGDMSTNPYLTGKANQYGFASTSRDSYNNPIALNGQVVLPPGISGSATTDDQWQIALDTIFGPRKTGWNAATNW